MQIIDTHSHLYLDNFFEDIDEVIQNAKENGLIKILLPNIDKESVQQIETLYNKDKKFFAKMMGLHPTSVNKDFENTLEYILNKKHLENICAIGEIGLDYYWSEEFKEQQKQAFQYQIDFAKQRNLPIAVHCRNSFDDILNILEKNADENLKGVLHCFTGNLEQAKRLINIGFFLGIGGVLTYKNSGLDKVIEHIDIKHLILETDSPFLTPTPFRGKRNESAYTIHIAKKLSEVKGDKIENIAKISTINAIKLFNLS